MNIVKIFEIYSGPGQLSSSDICPEVSIIFGLGKVGLSGRQKNMERLGSRTTQQVVVIYDPLWFPALLSYICVLHS